MDPNLIGLDRVGPELRFRWDDGLEARLTIADLRRACPCAHCVSELSGRRLLDPASIPDELALRDMKVVGRYAYRCLFGDSHDSGIYSLELLRALCEENARGAQARP